MLLFSILLPSLTLGTPPGKGWNLTFNEEFEHFDPSIWTKGWSWYDGNGHPQPRTQFKASDLCYFSDDNVYVKDGNLVIINKRERSHNFNYTSGVVNSIRYNDKQGFQQLYGYFEARILASPGGKNNTGMCPAFWLPNTLNNGDDGHCEIDVMEIPGGSMFGNGHTVYGTVHSGGGPSYDGSIKMDPMYWSKQYHNYSVWWEPTWLAWYVDDIMFFNTTKIIPSTPSYMVLDNEVGLGFKSPDSWWAGDPSNTPFPQLMYVDHVRVWQRKR